MLSSFLSAILDNVFCLSLYPIYSQYFADQKWLSIRFFLKADYSRYVERSDYKVFC